MKAVFADSLYWIAIVKPGDPWAGAATSAKTQIGQVRIVTTDEVLTEFLTALSGAGENLRGKAAQMVRAILSNPNVKVVPQSRGTFLQGLQLFEQRRDKEYSLTDCVSMNAMRSESIAEVLTNDHHFRQEGFTVLMNRQD
jgi:predicted nucleic acid-binding protein